MAELIDLHHIYLHEGLALNVSPEYGQHIVATENLDKLVKVFSIHKSQILSCRTSECPLSYEDLIELCYDANDDQVALYVPLAFVVAFEKLRGSASPWALYLSTLPSEVDISFLWDDNTTEWQMLAILAPHTFQYSRRFFLHVFERTGLDSTLHRLVQTGNVTLQDTRQVLLWAVAIVASRAFGLDLYHRNALIPVADLFNHAELPDVQIECDMDVCPFCGSFRECIHDNESADESSPKPLETSNLSTVCASPHLEDPEATCDMLLLRDISSGQQVYNTYGPGTPSSVLVRDYGFLSRDAPVQWHVQTKDLPLPTALHSQWLVLCRALDPLASLSLPQYTSACNAFSITLPNTPFSDRTIDLYYTHFGTISAALWLRLVVCDVASGKLPLQDVLRQPFHASYWINVLSHVKSLCSKHITLVQQHLAEFNAQTQRQQLVSDLTEHEVGAMMWWTTV